MSGVPAWLGALVGIPALLAAAKAHGRQVRLEREAQGYHSVQFGGGRGRSRGEDASERVRKNPAYVEQLWRRDRIRFWSVVPPAALALGALGWVRGGWPLALVGSLLLAPIVGFFVAGLRSYAATRLGGPGWWLAATGLAAAALVAAIL